LKLRVCAYRNPLRERGIELLRFVSVPQDPSLTLRVVINPTVFARLIDRWPETRNFKKRQGGDTAEFPARDLGKHDFRSGHKTRSAFSEI